jgi:hypothetical protein
MTNDAIEALVDQKPIRDWEAAMQAGAARLAAARVSLAAEQASHAIAAADAAGAEAGSWRGHRRKAAPGSNGRQTRLPLQAGVGNRPMDGRSLT